MELLTAVGSHVPDIPFVEVPSNNGAVCPAQKAGSALKVGVIGVITVIVILAVVAHKPAVGVKVYIVVAVLLIAGAQVPVIPFVDVVGKENNASPAQIAATWVNNGTVGIFTVMVMVAVVAHNPAVGVNVYKVVVVLFIAGNQVPVMPLVEVVGNAESEAPAQIAVTCVNVGTVGVFTVMVMVAVVAHKPAVGVKV